ncbi:hypothetical protein H6P81_017920 [Aristolochia fimbriata]|uniref:Putative plant transposon protein domain-containing protein n=1 Tax=Aristolochia fimbriata TaxID=158543 RepID=A0AAV7E2N7_ARIFI|nr:hypothetical protein H6P81_017920 [Aristolochia fimbriata]
MARTKQVEQPSARPRYNRFKFFSKEAATTYKKIKTKKTRDLRPEARVWMYFVCTCLLPSTHYTEVIVDYAILTSRLVNVGLMIHCTMMYTSETVGHRLYFPSLVIALCEASGIATRSGEEILAPECPITTMFIRNTY